MLHCKDVQYKKENHVIWTLITALRAVEEGEVSIKNEKSK